MLSVLRRSYGAQPRLLRNFAELVHVLHPSAPPPLKGTIDPPPPRAIAIGEPDKSQNVPDTENTIVPVRLGNRVPVHEDHGLYGFFRQREPEEGQTLVGEARYETVGGSYGMEMERSGELCCLILSSAILNFVQGGLGGLRKYGSKVSKISTFCGMFFCENEICLRHRTKIYEEWVPWL